MEPHQGAIEVSSAHKLTIVPNKSSEGLPALFEKRGDFAMKASAGNRVARAREYSVSARWISDSGLSLDRDNFGNRKEPTKAGC